MKRIAIALAVVIVAAGIVVAASGYLIRSLLSGTGGQRVVSALEKRAGVPVKVDSIDFDVAAWYRLTPALGLSGVNIGNPPGFSSKPLLTAEQVRVRVALRPLLQRRVEVESVALVHPVLAMEKNRQGISNLEVFVSGLAGNPGPPAAGDEPAAGARTPQVETTPQAETSVAIASIVVENGEVVMPNDGFRDIQLSLDDFRPGQPCGVKLSAVTNSQAGTLTFDGRLGPFVNDSLPLDGRLGARIRPALLPLQARKVQFGELLVEPGDKASLDLNADLKGDLFQVVDGSSRIVFRDVYVGRSGNQRLAMNGEAPLQISVRKLMSTPVADLKMRNAALRLGPGEWKGNIDLLWVGGVVRGKSSGSIRKVDINEFLSALTPASGKIEGVLEIPSYSVTFGGRDAAQIRRSLSGEASLSIDKGKLRALDLLASIRNAIEKPNSDATATGGDTPFTSLTAAAAIRDERLILDNILLGGPGLKAQGAGGVTFAQQLGFQLNVLVQGRVAELLGKASTAERAAETMVPMKISGTVANPKVFPDVRRLAVQTGVSYAEKILKGTPGEKLGEKLLDLIQSGKKKSQPPQ
jgi:uncharacterized protein involved in outer membrane biogenesis